MTECGHYTRGYYAIKWGPVLIESFVLDAQLKKTQGFLLTYTLSGQ